MQKDTTDCKRFGRAHIQFLSVSAPSNPSRFQPACSFSEVAKPTLFPPPSEQDPGLEDNGFRIDKSYFRLSQKT